MHGEQSYGVDPNDDVEDDSESEISVLQTPSILSDESLAILRSHNLSIHSKIQMIMVLICM